MLHGEGLSRSAARASVAQKYAFPLTCGPPRAHYLHAGQQHHGMLWADNVLFCKMSLPFSTLRGHKSVADSEKCRHRYIPLTRNL